MAVDPIGPPPVSARNESESVIPMQTGDQSHLKAFNDAEGPSFSDLLDVLNPLQHIPVINTIYRHLTGDTEGAVSDLVGGTLYGGLIGLGAAVVNLVVEDNTGKSIGDHVLALFTDDDQPTAVAQSDKDPSDKGTTAADDTTPAMPAPEPIQATSLAAASAGSAALSTADGGPVTAGDFLIFGGTLAPQAGKPIALGPSNDSGSPMAATRLGNYLVFGGDAAASAPAPSPASATTTAATVTAANTSGGSGPVRSGGFMVFGAGDPAADSLPDAAATPASAGPVQQAPAQAPAQAATQAPAIQPQARNFAVPARRASLTPPQSLPLPTTGPAAVPGNGRAVGMGANPEGSGWFVGAVNQAMDKYARAANLGPTTASDPATTPSALMN